MENSEKKNTCVLLDCERCGKYRRYKNDLLVIVPSIRKYDCSFKLQGKPICNGGGQFLKAICESHYHELVYLFKLLCIEVISKYNIMFLIDN